MILGRPKTVDTAPGAFLAASPQVECSHEAVSFLVNILDSFPSRQIIPLFGAFPGLSDLAIVLGPRAHQQKEA